MKVNSTGTCSKRRPDHSLLCATIAVAMAALIGAAGFGSAALAQSGPTGAIAADDLFAGPESPDFRGGVGFGVDRLVNIVKQAQQPGSQCPTDVDFTVMGGPHPDGPLVSQALAAARRDAIEAVLRGFGPTVRITAKYTSGIVSTVFISAQTAKDKEKPKLDVTWTPPKGTKVKARDRITAKAIARDDASLWQSGIKTIDLDVQGGGQFGFGDYPRPPQNCERAPPPRTLEGVYTVPPNPPPIVRLRAVAKDYAGHSAEDIAEFPTGDWYGTFGWTHICQGGGNRDETRGVSDLTLDSDGRGNLTGTLAGSTPERTQTMPTCSFRYVTPGTFSAKLVGSYTPGPDTFSAQAVEVRTTPGRASWTCPAGTTVTDQAFFTVYEGPMFRDAFRDLRRQPDGSRKSSGENTFSAGGSTCTTAYSLTLRQAQN